MGIRSKVVEVKNLYHDFSRHGLLANFSNSALHRNKDVVSHRQDASRQHGPNCRVQELDRHQSVSDLLVLLGLIRVAVDCFSAQQGEHPLDR